MDPVGVQQKILSRTFWFMHETEVPNKYEKQEAQLRYKLRNCC